MQKKSAYATYCEEKGVTPVGVYIDSPLVELTKKAAKLEGKTHVGWIRDVFADAVNAAGFEYSAPTPENLKDELARAKAELEELKAQIAKAQTPPTPPAEKANAETGKVEAK